MRKTLFLALLFMSCHNNNIVTGRVERVFTYPWPRSGNILYYELTYNNKDKIDTTYIIGNKIENKATGQVFMFEVGDSINIQLGVKPEGLYLLNKFT